MDLNIKILSENKKLVVTNCNNTENIQKSFENYINEYVKCKRCGNYDTIVSVTKNTRRKFYIANCKKCKAIFPIKHSKDI